MSGLPPRARRSLGRTLSRLAGAGVAESLSLEAQATDPGNAARIGFTGAPGAGKSTLISRFARLRLDHCRERGGVAVLAVDPASPKTGGAILGDRIRMDAIANEPDLYIRSLSSRSSSDGLADNLADLVDATATYGFHEVLVETVGVGQAEHAVHHLVDTLVMVLQPNAGDAVQAMKAGILEMADVYVVNKADLPGARKTASEIRAIVRRTDAVESSWTPPVIEIAEGVDEGLLALDEAVTDHLSQVVSQRDPVDTARMRRRYHLQSLVTRRIGELLDQHPTLLDAGTLSEAYQRLLSTLRDDQSPR